ncbi:CRISPR-associated endonuclease Cas9 [Polystyrenella longa]|uniref:CRISPR-associated endonuclease Cas9 n=1 Tax=Polystyrenella longa TaxID=2528007 RepID=A0A518CIZ0_9PLAN|nr:HNH endonuclease [Polystyrenella longa]QDU79192.1 CRISPR-associated endonuclease Cas9 [Polystyrenella longa]
MVTSSLSRPTLVLNRNWQPVGIVPVSRALIKVWNESAHIVDPENYATYTWHDWAELDPEHDEPCIVTNHSRLRVPEIVTLTSYDRIPKRTVAFSRRNLFRRDKFTCQYCSKQPGSAELTIDHVLPRSRGGVSSWDNCVLACINCNKRKADKTPKEAHMPLLAEPVRPPWKPIYASFGKRIDSWSKFMSEAYWNVELEE